MNSSVSVSPDKQRRVEAALLSFACGDALGMATEFMTREQIEGAFPGGVTRLLEQKDSQNHGDLTPGSVTDDTEQVAYLLERYRAKGEVTVEDTVDALLAWIREAGAVEKHYIGPSSLKALNANVYVARGYVRTMLENGTTASGRRYDEVSHIACTWIEVQYFYFILINYAECEIVLMYNHNNNV